MRRIAIAGVAIATSHIAFAVAVARWIVRSDGGNDDARRLSTIDAGERSPLYATRIELADLRERIRSLERIAAGIDC